MGEYIHILPIPAKLSINRYVHCLPIDGLISDYSDINLPPFAQCSFGTSIIKTSKLSGLHLSVSTATRVTSLAKSRFYSGERPGAISKRKMGMVIL